MAGPPFRPVAALHARGVLGRVVHAVVCEDAGRPLYDLPVWQESGGAVIVPVRPDGALGFVRAERPVPMAPEHAVPYAEELRWEACGTRALELPRGFGEPGESAEQAARREAEEELSMRVQRIEALGHCNPNTTFFVHAVPVFRAHVSGVLARADSDPRECIAGVEFLTLDEALRAVARGDILCGFTQAALLLHLAQDRL